ncbi:hypothetical protein KUCAC02_029906 [Chaenocephalus aceratus]|uniref:Uncharacterized protein n=1 Tax=Chaenocephalus aceratus TaxID=36190 RepID=A0ACB9XI60_CHAAC|nr:hypothetical protein KUCAC02_029906 [Chaenocephalus aceratus]
MNPLLSKVCLRRLSCLNVPLKTDVYLLLQETPVCVKVVSTAAGPAISPSSPSLSPKSEAQSPGEISTSWVVDSSGFLSPTGPVLKEVLDMVDGDIDGWCNLEAFDLPVDSPSPERHQFRLEASALQELSKNGKGELIPISPGGMTPPSILTHRSRRRIALSPDGNNSMTPKSTPVKILAFSPSQFLNMWTKQDSHDLENPSLTSTPVCSQRPLVSTPLQRDKTPLTQKENSVFVTPNHKAGSVYDPTNADAVQKRHGEIRASAASASDSQPGRRHQRSDPERRWGRLRVLQIHSS